MKVRQKDTFYMQQALNLAKKGIGFVNPNPLVGAVIVLDDEIIGTGYHEKYGELHAERNALKNCVKSPKNADIYVTLEPCCHYGKNPPCTEAIIESGIKRVFIGSDDPNPLVAGKGIQILRQNGIEVHTGILKQECDSINEVFLHYISTQTPYVILKYAMTLDGKIACYTGESRWITGEEARLNVHKDRHKYAAIMVGVGTVIADDPMLNCRFDGNVSQPMRIICDTNLRTPINSKIIKTAKQYKTIIAVSTNENHQPYIEAGCDIITVKKGSDGKLDLSELIKKIGELKIDSVIIEGGSVISYSALKYGIVNKIQSYIAPKIFGGVNSPSPVGGIGVSIPDNCVKIENIEITKLGDDYLFEGRVINCLQE